MGMDFFADLFLGRWSSRFYPQMLCDEIFQGEPLAIQNYNFNVGSWFGSGGLLVGFANVSYDLVPWAGTGVWGGNVKRFLCVSDIAKN